MKGSLRLERSYLSDDKRVPFLPRPGAAQRLRDITAILYVKVLTEMPMSRRCRRAIRSWEKSCEASKFSSPSSICVS